MIVFLNLKCTFASKKKNNLLVKTSYLITIINFRNYKCSLNVRLILTFDKHVKYLLFHHLNSIVKYTLQFIIPKDQMQLGECLM